MIVGPLGEAVTVKTPLVLTVELPTCTVITPVVAPAGATATRLVGVADCTTALAPLKLTRLEEAVELKPVPTIDTAVPTGPCWGEK